MKTNRHKAIGIILIGSLIITRLDFALWEVIVFGIGTAFLSHEYVVDE